MTGSVSAIVAASSCSKYGWGNRGRAPKGYLEGVAGTYAQAVCSWKAGAALERAVARPLSDQPEAVRDRTDALSWYASNFRAAGLANNGDDLATLRHVYTLLIGLGMRESSGRYCCGLDTQAGYKSADQTEAGIFQTSYNARSSHPELPKLFALYHGDKSPPSLLEVFKQGVSCSAADRKNWGSGDGQAFQALEKDSPAFATRFASLVLRASGGTQGHYGPLRTKAAEIRPECDAMLEQVEKATVCQ